MLPSGADSQVQSRGHVIAVDSARLICPYRLFRATEETLTSALGKLFTALTWEPCPLEA
jgi:hypothetical protein